MSLSKLKVLLTVSIYLIFLGCAKNSLVYEIAPDKKLFSCVNYDKLADPNFDSDDLYAFWDIFVADAKCSMSSNPDYDKLNTDVDIFYEYESDALFASGEVLDYGAYAATSCDDSRVRVGIAFGYWNDIKIPAKALFSGDHSTIDSSLYSISPFEITYPSLPVITFERVLFPEPFRPITAWISPGLMLRSTPFNISFPEIPACSFFTFSISPLQI